MTSNAAQYTARLLVLAAAWLVDDLASTLAAEAAVPAQAPPDHAIVVPFERFAADSEKLPPAEAGRLLLGELNCTSCHKPTPAAAALLERKQAPDLEGLGARARLSWIRDFVADPQATKPGTTMPNVLAALPANQRQQQLDFLVHFLASTGSIIERGTDGKLIGEGKNLYHQVGCVACHGPREGAAALPDTVPLSNLAAKYSPISLAAFLVEPHKARPSGRMPSLNLTIDEAKRIASYLLKDLKSESIEPVLNYAYYEGEWSQLPKFADLKPVAEGTATGFDTAIARNQNGMALRFSGYLRIDVPGRYTFYTNSDDGSRLWIDDQLVVNNDGIHAPKLVGGDAIQLSQGMHRLVVGMFNGGGGSELDVEFEGGGHGRQPVLPLLSLTAAGPKRADPNDKGAFLFDGDKAAKGREAFLSLGCASCHALSKAKPEEDPLIAPPALAQLKTSGGCLAEAPPAGVPHFQLSKAQRAALAAGIRALAKPPAVTPAAVVKQTLLAFNCYACHARDGLGGVEEDREAFFETQQKEMGDEGRLPPPLTGVGAKLNTRWFKHIWADGAKDRPYMLARMPKFGEASVGQLSAALEAVDKIEPIAAADFKSSPADVKAAGRHLVGDKGLGCVKCHNFRDIPSTGVQAMNMTLMPERLKRDWFHRYLLNPQAFRPGTRMPAAWPNGQSFFKKVLDGTADTQIEAVWTYLSDGDKAAIPYGLSRGPIELTPDKEAIIYRNFIEGAGPRAIGVGYPEKVNLAFDANDLRLALIWQGGFIDAARHWTDRGAGYQPPLGDNIIALPQGPSFAVLATESDPWPAAKTAKGLGQKFRGYHTTKDDRPAFRYEVAGVEIDDFPTGVAAEPKPGLRRTLTVKPTPQTDKLYYRAASGSKIQAAADGWYAVGDQFKTRLETTAKPLVRQVNGQAELLVPVPAGAGEFKIVQDYAW